MQQKTKQRITIHPTDDKLQFASCSNDQSILLWQAVPSTQSMKPVIYCKGHEEMVNCISLSPNKKWVCLFFTQKCECFDCVLLIKFFILILVLFQCKVILMHCLKRVQYFVQQIDYKFILRSKKFKNSLTINYLYSSWTLKLES